MIKRRILGISLLLAPPIIWLAVELSGYEWIWNRTSHSIAVGFFVTSLSFILMAIGLRVLFRSWKEIVSRTVLLGATIFAVQFYNIGLDGFAQMSDAEPVGGGRQAFTLRYAAFGSSWTDVYTTQTIGWLLRKTDHIRQYNAPALIRLQAGPAGALDVIVTEYGKPEQLHRYTPSEIEIIGK